MQSQTPLAALAPALAGPAVRTPARTVAGFRRLAVGRGVRKAVGVRWEAADRAAQLAAGAGDLCGLRDAAPVAVASDALLRVPEVAALDVADVNADDQTVLIRRSKTDAAGQGSVQFLGKPTVARVGARLQAAGLAEGPCSGPSTAGERRLSERSVRSIIVQRARAAGVKGRGERSHPAGGKRPEPDACGRFAGRDADRRALGAAGHAGAVRAGAVGRGTGRWRGCGTGRRGVRPSRRLRDAMQRNNGGVFWIVGSVWDKGKRKMALKHPCRYLVTWLMLLAGGWVATCSSAADVEGDIVRREYAGFTLEIDCTKRGPILAHYKLGFDLANKRRKSGYYYDAQLDRSCQQTATGPYPSDNVLFSYDRGHLVPANHMDNHETTIRASNVITNILPQAKGLNRKGGAWWKTEDLIECWRDEAPLEIWIAVNWGTDAGNDYFVNSHGIATPDAFLKLVYRPKDRKAIAWSLPNKEILDDDLDMYLATLGNVENVIGRPLRLPGVDKTKKADLADWPEKKCDLK